MLQIRFAFRIIRFLRKTTKSIGNKMKINKKYLNTISTLYVLTLVTMQLLPATLFGQKPEKQISFANENKPHSYYVKQAELWWKEVQKDSLSEENWYNYFRACRNSQGSNDWKSDFINESPYLKFGPDIIELIKKNIPNTFTYYYLSYLDGGIGTDNGDNLLKAYKMNPRFEGIQSSVVSYAESSLNNELRKEANNDWFKTNNLSPQLLNYGYNVLMSMDSNAVLLTQNDNDTYPLWMLQDALGIRTDITVINIDFLLLENYRDKAFRSLNIPSMDFKTVSIDEYHLNWQKIVTHVLKNYAGKKPIYLGMTLFQHLYQNFADKLTVSGLTFKFSKKNINLMKFNKKLFEQVFLLDYLDHQFFNDGNQSNVDYQNLNYINLFKVLYDNYKAAKDNTNSQRIRSLSIKLAKRTDDPDYINTIKEAFK